MSKHLILFMIFLVCGKLLASSETPLDENATIFGGRISRLNREGRIARIRTDFTNIKFFNKQDRLEFWNESYPMSRCGAYVEARSNDYLLIKIPEFERCVRLIHFTTGSYLHFDSKDLKLTLGQAKEVVEVLKKKRLALQAKKARNQRELDSYVERVDIVNKRFEILRQKLEIEWQKELSNLEEDKARSYTEFKSSEARLNEIDTKLEAYRIEDQNLKLDRWSLDPNLYYRK